MQNNKHQMIYNNKDIKPRKRVEKDYDTIRSHVLETAETNENNINNCIAVTVKQNYKLKLFFKTLISSD